MLKEENGYWLLYVKKEKQVQKLRKINNLM